MLSIGVISNVFSVCVCRLLEVSDPQDRDDIEQIFPEVSVKTTEAVIPHNKGSESQTDAARFDTRGCLWPILLYMSMVLLYCRKQSSANFLSRRQSI